MEHGFLTKQHIHTWTYIYRCMVDIGTHFVQSSRVLNRLQLGIFTAYICGLLGIDYSWTFALPCQHF